MYIIQPASHQECLTPQHTAEKHKNCMLKITLRKVWQNHLKKTSGQTFKWTWVLWFQWTEVHTSAENWLLAFTLHTTLDLERSLQSTVPYNTSQESIQNNKILIIRRRSVELITLRACIFEDNNSFSVLRV